MRLADSRAKATGKKQWVIRTHNGELRVVNRHDVHVLKFYGALDKKLTAIELNRDALYVTEMSNRSYLNRSKEK